MSPMKLLQNSYGSQCADSKDTLEMYVSIFNFKQCVHEMNVCRPEPQSSRQSETGSEFGKRGICPTLNDLWRGAKIV